MPAKTLGAILPYYGGKRDMGPMIARELEHENGRPRAFYAEPYAGSMAVLLSKKPSGHEVVNDLWGPLINLAFVIQSDRYTELRERVERTLYAQPLYDAVVDHAATFKERKPPGGLGDIDDACVEWAWAFLVREWYGQNGYTGTERTHHSLAIRNTPGGGGGATRRAAVERAIPSWHDRLRKVEIRRTDAVELIAGLDDSKDVAIFADPPYFHDTRGKGGTKYVYDVEDKPSGGLFAGDGHRDHHDRLADVLNAKRETRVVVTYYAHPRLAELYPKDRWTHVDATRLKNLHAQNRRGAMSGAAAQAPEVVLINGPAWVIGGCS